MFYEWDERKNASNTAKHGVSFEAVYGFDWETSMIAVDNRRDYGERRYMALGLIGKRLFSCVYVDRGQYRRIISLRKASNSEIKKFSQG